MVSAIETVESKIIDRLIGHYKLDQKNSKSIYDETVQLDHRIATLTDLNQLNSIDNKIKNDFNSFTNEHQVILSEDSDIDDDD
ncbi:unnamed protein product [Adineta steineri]|uniref:Uncharacterized protein n=1 Tax=Adineta steineri TaxID=433720 RepID=A0A814BS34_9BILA|nr:unnamed protein product [Adineta steineri]